MPYRKTSTSVLPNPEVQHFFETTDATSMIAFVHNYFLTNNQALYHEEIRENLTLKLITTWSSKADADAAESLLSSAFPYYIDQRNAYHQQNNITWTEVYEDIPA